MGPDSCPRRRGVTQAFPSGENEILKRQLRLLVDWFSGPITAERWSEETDLRWAARVNG
jgi:aminoglycoside/choline kinase family phosphotransferase